VSAANDAGTVSPMSPMSPMSPLRLADALDRVADLLGPLAERDVALGPLTTYRVGGPAAVLARVESVEHLVAVHRALAGAGAEDLPLLVVGRGSNLLVADAGFAGVAVLLGPFATEIVVDGGDVIAGAAVSLPVLARQTVAAGLTGLEWAVGVPGSVGGGVRMNAGGHGSDMAASLAGVRVFDLRSGEDGEVPVSALGLRFRGSDLADHQVVVSARFSLAPGDRAASEAELAEIVRWRREHQPGGQNAGSVFVNPVPGALSAGELIDDIGLRGLRLGTAQVSPKHANFIQADEGGSADDVRALMAVVRARALAAHGLALRSEIRQIGFDGDADGEVGR
jgi:UDP-N-acetylmuramate dehydrogenase